MFVDQLIGNFSLFYLIRKILNYYFLFSGKTKSVDLLCSISNKFCNVDTIDDSVTGSFQQIDFNRHLEEIATSVKAIVYDHVKSFALENNIDGKVKITVLLSA